MTWQALPLCFQLKSPMHIGCLPNRPGTVLAPTRYYVPGKNFWGALTALITPVIYEDISSDKFQTVGETLRKKFRFSYFFLSDGQDVFYPQYTLEHGLQWNNLTTAQFEHRFIYSRLSTKLSKAGNAETGTLHEIEYISHIQKFPDDFTSKPVYLTGILWKIGVFEINGKAVDVSEDGFLIGESEPLKHLILGGERNYGFGKIEMVELPEQLKGKVSPLFKDISPGEGILSLKQNTSLVLKGHCRYEPDWEFYGDIEIVAGRVYPSHQVNRVFFHAGQKIESDGYYFAPGTQISIPRDTIVQMNEWGVFLSVR